MSLLRFAARTLLASYFVINGAKAVRHPEDFIDAGAPIMDKVVPTLKAALPAEAQSVLPQDAAGAARCNGALQIVGGISLATGIGRRLGAGLLAASMIPQVLADNPLGAASDHRAKFGADLAVLGGVVLAAMDTEGEPDLAWRLRAHRRLAAKQSAHSKAELAKTTKAVAGKATRKAKRLRKQAEGALS